MLIILCAVNAKYIHMNPAVYSLKAFAGADLADYVEMKEYTINQRKENILADLSLQNPDMVCFSCYIWNIGLIQELLEDMHKVMPETVIYLGGPEVSSDPEKWLSNYRSVAGVMVGEGEQTFRELAEKYTAGYNPCEIKIQGLYTRAGYAGDRPLLSLAKLPFFYEDYKDLKPFANKILYYESSRGCPYRCSYCLSAVDKMVRLKDREQVKRELAFFLEKGVKQVKFIDRTFNCNKEHALFIWKFLRQNDNGITNFHFEIAADILTQEELAEIALMRPGLIQLEIGIQTTNISTLKEINRPMSFELIQKHVLSIGAMKKVHQHLDLIAGLPYEDYKSFVSSFNDVYALHPNQLQLGFLKVLKGSPMSEKAEEYGIFVTSAAPYEVLCTKWITYKEILSLKRVEEMVESYYNSGQFVHTLRLLVTCFLHPFEMYEQLALLVSEKGGFDHLPDRVTRFEYLLAFACKKKPEWEKLFRELLTFDLYLRENRKSRPDFCPDLTEYYQKIREITKNNKNTSCHVEVFRYPVWEEEPEKVSVQSERENFVLLQYTSRNPLTKEANYVMI